MHIYFTEDDSGNGKKRAGLAVKKRLEKIEKYGTRLNEYLSKNFNLTELPSQYLDELQLFQ